MDENKFSTYLGNQLFNFLFLNEEGQPLFFLSSWVLEQAHLLQCLVLWGAFASSTQSASIQRNTNLLQKPQRQILIPTSYSERKTNTDFSHSCSSIILTRSYLLRSLVHAFSKSLIKASVMWVSCFDASLYNFSTVSGYTEAITYAPQIRHTDTRAIHFIHRFVSVRLWKETWKADITFICSVIATRWESHPRYTATCCRSQAHGHGLVEAVCLFLTIYIYLHASV